MATTRYTDTRFATQDAVLAQIEVWTAPVVQCRSWRHAWEHYTSIQSPKIAVEVHACSRCGGFRHREIDPKTGAADSWLPDYPDGYLMPKGSGRVAGAALNPIRLAALKSTNVVKVKHSELQAELRELIAKGKKAARS